MASESTFPVDNTGAQLVHRHWRDIMLSQGRDVPAERMAWETLQEQDKDLNRRLYQAIIDDSIDVLALTAAKDEFYRACMENLDRATKAETACTTLEAQLAAKEEDAKVGRAVEEWLDKAGAQIQDLLQAISQAKAGEK